MRKHIGVRFLMRAGHQKILIANAIRIFYFFTLRHSRKPKGVTMKLVLLIFAICFLLPCVILTSISLGFRKPNTKYTKGYLKTSIHKQNTIEGRRLHPHYTKASYTYRVGSTEYSLPFHISGKPNEFPKTADIRYQKNHPKRAYIQGLTFPLYPIGAGFCDIASIFFTMMAIFI